IDGAVVPRTAGKGLSLFGTPTSSHHARGKPFAIASQELTDVQARLRDLDRFGIETQIINSTLLNATLSPDVEFEHALCRAYNTWIAEVSAQSHGRLRWNAMLRLTHIQNAMTSCAALPASVLRLQRSTAWPVTGYSIATISIRFGQRPND